MNKLTPRQVNQLQENDEVFISTNNMKQELYKFKESTGDTFSRQFYFENENGDSLKIDDSEFQDIELELIIERF